MHSTYNAISKVWAVEDKDGLHLFSTPEAAESYAAENQGRLLDPMPVLSRKTVWHRMGLRFAGNGYDWKGYVIEKLETPTKERPATAATPSVRCLPDENGGYLFEVCAKTHDEAYMLAGWLGDVVVGWVKAGKKLDMSLPHRLALALKARPVIRA